MLKDEDKFTYELTWINHITGELIKIHSLEIAEDPDGLENASLCLERSEIPNFRSRKVIKSIDKLKLGDN